MVHAGYHAFLDFARAHPTSLALLNLPGAATLLDGSGHEVVTGTVAENLRRTLERLGHHDPALPEVLAAMFVGMAGSVIRAGARAAGTARPWWTCSPTSPSPAWPASTPRSCAGWTAGETDFRPCPGGVCHGYGPGMAEGMGARATPRTEVVTLDDPRQATPHSWGPRRRCWHVSRRWPAHRPSARS